MSTRRIRLIVQYDGSNFCGWAAQKGRRTVQRTLKDAVRQISGEDCEIIGASRTDSGAHALGQVCHFDTEVNIEPEKWEYVLNRSLPDDLAIAKSDQVASDFNSRFFAKDRWYRYRILTGTRDPIRGRFATWTWHDLDLSLMKQAAVSLIGDHDFRGFSEEVPLDKSTQRVLRDVRVSRFGDEVRIDIVGLAFVRGMMRRMSGGLLEVGRGKRTLEEFAGLLDPQKRDGIHWPEVLPARGLTLMKVRYGRHPRDFRDLTTIEEEFDS